MDAGERRNRFASHSHGFLGQDGKAPGDIIAEARRQIERYPTIHWAKGRVTNAEGSFDDFVIEIDGNRRERAARLILATGVTDELPDIAGLEERWGSAVFHCPYCHGYELDQRRIGVIAASPLAIHHALMLPDWGETTFLPMVYSFRMPNRMRFCQPGAFGWKKSVSERSQGMRMSFLRMGVALLWPVFSRNRNCGLHRIGSKSSAAPWKKGRWVQAS